MHTRRPTGAKFLFQTSPAKRKPAFVCKCKSLIFSAYPDHQRGRIRHVPELFITFQLRGFGSQCANFRDIHTKAGQPNRVTLGIANRRAAPLHTTAPPVLLEESAFKEYVPPVCRCGGGVIRSRTKRMTQVNKFTARMSDDLTSGPSREGQS